MAKAGRVSERERERALRQNQDVQYATLIGISAMRRVGRATLASALRSWRSGTSVQGAIADGLKEMEELLLQATMYAELRGMDRTSKTFQEQTGRDETQPVAAARGPAYTRGIRFLQRRLKLSPTQLAAMTAGANQEVVQVVATATVAAQKKIQEAVVEIAKENLTTREGTKALRQAWAAEGLGERNGFQLEAIMRTQTQLAFAAGMSMYERTPEISEILWGYKYVTVGDDRVRESHIGLDGVTLPKEDSFWRANKPPNGWACRCQLIQVFRPRKKVAAPNQVTVDGKLVPQGADEGFGFDPGRLIPKVA